MMYLIALATILMGDLGDAPAKEEAHEWIS
jgi:hypothetical protein